jgi:predicted transposase/invertase (TIGR01784 family)
MASEVLITISRDEEERAWLRSREKYILDTQSNLSWERKEGHAEGRTEKALEIARNLKKMGLPVSQIAEITGLTAEEVMSC